MRRVLLVGGVILLVAILYGCSDGLASAEDEPLADRAYYFVYGTTYLENPNPPPWWIAHEADVGLRHVYVSPYSTYIDTTTSDEETGYEFPLDELDDGWYACDAWFEIGAVRWQGSSDDFRWTGGNPTSFLRNIYMHQQ